MPRFIMNKARYQNEYLLLQQKRCQIQKKESLNCLKKVKIIVPLRCSRYRRTLSFTKSSSLLIGGKSEQPDREKTKTKKLVFTDKPKKKNNK